MVLNFCIVFGLHYLLIRQASPQQNKKLKLYGFNFLFCLRFALSLHTNWVYTSFNIENKNKNR
jgi:hypothetical protein